MWLSTALAVIAVATATRDFPELISVMFDICGEQKFDLTPSSPCQFRLFGLALAWQECGDAYQANMEGFRSCLDSCVSPSICPEVCAGIARSATQQQQQQQCRSECSMVTGCTDQALAKATGQVSAASDVRQCFMGRTHYGASPGTAAVAPQAAALLEMQIANVSALLRRAGTSAPRLAVTTRHRRITPGGVATRGDCACESTNLVRGVQTGQGGCRRHGRESQASGDWYCFISGGIECPGAMPSREFEGLFWLGCAGPFEYYAQLFPARCRLREFGFSPQDKPLQTPRTPTGHGTLQLGTPVPPEPRFQAEVVASAQQTLDAAVPLPQEWHAQHSDVFLKPRATPPDPGQPLPAALSTPLWWELAQRPHQGPAPSRPIPKVEKPEGPLPANQHGFWPGGRGGAQRKAEKPEARQPVANGGFW